MGVTEPWMVTTEWQKNWTAACEREIAARFYWNGKWGWMPSVMAETIKRLKELKVKQSARIQEKRLSSRKILPKDPRPLPNSSNHEYGWLATKPEYQIERFGPFPLTMKVRVVPTLQEIDDEVIRQDAERAHRALEKKKEKQKSSKPDRSDEESSVQDMDEIRGQSEAEYATGPIIEQKDALEIISADHPMSQMSKDPGHVRSDGRKVKLCCCTAQCICKRLGYRNKE